MGVGVWDVLIDVAQAALQVLIGGFERVILLDHLADLVLELPAFLDDSAHDQVQDLAHQVLVLDKVGKVLLQVPAERLMGHPFTLLPTRLIEQRTSARTTFLRWQHIASRRMGVGVWNGQLGA